MDFEVVYDFAEAANEIGLVLDADRHELLPDGEWIQWARRTYGKPDLFLYRHRVTGNFVLAEWVRRPESGNPVCIELEAVPEPLDRCPSQLSPGFLGLRLVPTATIKERMRRKVREAKLAHAAATDKEVSNRGEAIAHMRSCGYELEAMQVERGQLMGDWSTFGDEDPLVDEMVERASGRLVVGGA